MRIGGIFSSMNISASALSVQRQKMEVIAKNLANVSTTRTDEGGPYRRETAVIREQKPAGRFETILNRLRMRCTNYGHRTGSYSLNANAFEAGGVEVDDIVKDGSSPKIVYDPQHPDADADGYVRMPNINSITEMVNIISATRAYEANLTVINATKNIVKKSLEI